jgi:FkbM family methyltransferase
MAYYSQSGQDRYLDTQVFQGFRRGVFVEIGAWDGVDLSNTAFFERERSWTGLVVEPLPDRYQTLITQRKCKTSNVAISDVEGEAEFLALSGPTSMLSGIVANYDPRHVDRINREAEQLDATKTILKVPTRRLDSLFREHNLPRIHYLSVDVEGSEFQVLKSIDFNAVYIDVIGFEDNYPDKTREVVAYLTERGYTTLHTGMCDYLMVHARSPFAPKRFSILRR